MQGRDERGAEGHGLSQGGERTERLRDSKEGKAQSQMETGACSEDKRQTGESDCESAHMKQHRQLMSEGLTSNVR